MTATPRSRLHDRVSIRTVDPTDSYHRYRCGCRNLGNQRKAGGPRSGIDLVSNMVPNTAVIGAPCSARASSSEWMEAPISISFPTSLRTS